MSVLAVPMGVILYFGDYLAIYLFQQPKPVADVSPQNLPVVAYARRQCHQRFLKPSFTGAYKFLEVYGTRSEASGKLLVADMSYSILDCGFQEIQLGFKSSLIVALL